MTRISSSSCAPVPVATKASLFVSEVFRMYLRFAEQHHWKVEGSF